MVRYEGAVLVDTNVIVECWRTNAWRAIAGAYRLETVEDCIIETQTGYQRRAPEQQIDEAALRHSLAAIHGVSQAQQARAALRDPTYAVLDTGERALWAHALARADAWMLCGPDKASLRFGIRIGLHERLVALEALLHDAGHNARGLRPAYEREWHRKAVAELMAERRP